MQKDIYKRINKYMIHRPHIKKHLPNSPKNLILNLINISPVGETYWLSGYQVRHLIGYKWGRRDPLSPARRSEYLSKKKK